VRENSCPNLIAEAGLYRWGEAAAERTAEVPVDAHNHALSALRYLIASLDDRRLAGRPAPNEPKPPTPRRAWHNCDPRLWDNPEVWTGF
jgi:hypothetical protein